VDTTGGHPKGHDVSDAAAPSEAITQPGRCIPGCTADHATQPPAMQECSAHDALDAVGSTVAGMTPASVRTSRWQDPSGAGGEVVVYPPEHEGESVEPVTFTPSQAHQLAGMLHRGAELVDRH
jgi:hypothetical protein